MRSPHWGARWKRDGNRAIPVECPADAPGGAGGWGAIAIGDATEALLWLKLRWTQRLHGLRPERKVQRPRPQRQLWGLRQEQQLRSVRLWPCPRCTALL